MSKASTNPPPIGRGPIPGRPVPFPRRPVTRVLPYWPRRRRPLPGPRPGPVPQSRFVRAINAIFNR